jgi:Bacterial Ig domain/Cellulase (glycosyl hydrolase family 5)
VLLFGALLALGAVVAGAAESAPTPPATPITFAIADDAAQRAFPSELASAHGVGFGAARAYVGWADVASRRPANPRNPADPAYDWTQTDADMARYQAAGLAVWIALWRTPAWASGSSDTAVWAKDPSDLEDFAYAVATRYPQVKVFMDWNEPNLKQYASPNTIAAYEPMARAVYAGVKAADPSAEVIAGNLAMYRDNGRDPAAWGVALRADHVPMDAFGVHPYPPWDAPLASRSPRTRIDLFDVPALARLVGVPVAVTEFGWSSQLAGLANQATWTAQAIDVARCTPGLSQFVFWGYHDHPVPAGQTPDPWVMFGWLDASGAPKPVYAAGAAAFAGTPDCATIGAAAGAPAGWPATNTIPPAYTTPVCNAASLTTLAGTTASVDLACTDADGTTLSYTVGTAPANGTVTQSGSVFAYTPYPGFAGSDGFTVLAHDGIAATPIAVTVTVTAPVAAPPDAQATTSDETPPAPPIAAPPAIAPLVSAASTASLRGSISLRRGVVTLQIGCTGALTSCTGSLRLSSRVHGSTRSLGARLVSIQPETSSTVRVSVPSGTRGTLRLLAGKAISVRALLVTSSPGGALRWLTRSFPLRVPR